MINEKLLLDMDKNKAEMCVAIIQYVDKMKLSDSQLDEEAFYLNTKFQQITKYCNKMKNQVVE